MPAMMARRVRIGIVAAVLLVLIAGIVLATPELVRRRLVAGIEARVVEPVSIDDVDLNLLTGRVRVTGLRVGAQAAPLLRVPIVDTELRYWPLLHGQTVLGYLTLHQPELHLVRTGPARFNLLDAWRPSERPADGAGTTVEALAIHDGTVTFIDRTETPRVERSITDIELSAGRVSSTTGLRVSPTSFRAELTIGSGTVAIEGSATPLASPRTVALGVTASQLDVSLLAPYLPGTSRLELGKIVEARARYVVSAAQGRTTEHVVSGRFTLGPLRMRPARSGDPTFSLDAVVVEGGRFDFLANAASVREVTLRAPRVSIERAPDGRLALDVGLPSRPVGPSAGEEAPFTIAIERARVADGRLRLVDHSVSPTAVVPIDDVNVSMADLRLGRHPHAATIAGTAGIGGGRLQLSGALRPQPVSGDLVARLADVPFAPFTPYADAALGAARAGASAVGGVLECRFGDGAVRLSGRLTARDVEVRSDQAPDTATPPIASARRLLVDIGHIELAPSMNATIRRIQVERPIVRLVRDEDGRVNLSALVSRAPSVPSSPAAAAKPGAGSSPSRAAWSVARLGISRGTVTFRDEAVAPVFTGELTGMNAALTGLRPGPHPAHLTVAGRLGDSPLQLTGRLSLAAARPILHLEGDVEGYTLSQLDPYADRYLGYRIRRGHLTADVELSRDPNGFDSVAQLTIRQIQLGQRTSDTFRERIGIPLTLVLDLLEGLDGSIHLRIPVSGRLTNPSFSLADAIWDALRNTIVKLAAAPLRAIGSVVTLGGRIGRVRLDPVGFTPGAAELNESAQQKLAEMAEWLRSKPRIELEIRGSATAAEAAAVRERRLRERAEKAGSGDYMTGLSLLYKAEKGFGAAGSAEQMEQVLRERISVSRSDLAELANTRAATVQAALVRRGVPGNRLYVVSEGERAVTTEGAGLVRFEVL